MQKTPLIGVVLEQTPSTIVMQEDEARATYSREFYRLPHDQDHVSSPIAISWTDPLPVEMTYGLHGVLAPVSS
jgi:hypothetical protein